MEILNYLSTLPSIKTLRGEEAKFLSSTDPEFQREAQNMKLQL